MIVAIASGKGGTGKTTVATNLAHVASAGGRRVHLCDCDVEEPNCHIFVKPIIEHRETVKVSVPKVNQLKCTACGQCAQICAFGAIVCIKKHVLTFPELCHGCTACWTVCPEEVIVEQKREIGSLESGRAGGFKFTQGSLNIGEAMPVPVIRKVKNKLDREGLSILDAPPGTSCSMVMTLKDSDYVCLVTEPTPFGLNDLELAVEVVRKLGLPIGVIINRCGTGNGRVRDYCRDQELEILAEIPDDRRVAEAYSRGMMACEEIPEMKEIFLSLLARIRQKVNR
jgi:MinD superfamily P-loop ATPase